MKKLTYIILLLFITNIQLFAFSDNISETFKNCYTTRIIPTTNNLSTSSGAVEKNFSISNSYGTKISSISSPTTSTPSGTGTAADPYLISNLAELYWIALQVNSVTDYSSVFLGKYFKQTADIDASSTSTWFPDGSGGYYGWSPIGYDNSKNFTAAYFGGIYDGQGHTISGLYINRLQTNYVGLWGVVYSGTVKNLGLINVSITAGGNSNGAYCGALSGYLYSGAVIDNCYSTGSVSGYDVVGGLVGEDDGSDLANSIMSSHSSCAVTVENGQGGGLIGNSGSSAISNCYATGNVTASGMGGAYMGGLIGMNYSTVSRCYATGSATGTYQVAGLIGANYTNIDNCYATGAVTATAANNGGLLGHNEGIVNNCYATGLAIGASATGGFVGSNAYAGTINNNCFWNSTILSTGCGSNSATFSAVGKTTNEMQTTSTFTSAGWDFRGETTNGNNNYWDRVDYKNNKYPYLSWQYPATAPTVTTQAVSIIGSISATGNGSITDFGSSNPIAHGVCWNTTGTPTISNSKTNEGAASATGAFTSSITGLSPNTMYYVRAYATNTAETSYGDEVSFTTSIGTNVDHSSLNNLSIYPNPAVNGFTINIEEKTSTVSIYDISGCLVLTQQANKKTYIDISSLQKGVYLVKTNEWIGELVKK